VLSFVGVGTTLLATRFFDPVSEAVQPEPLPAVIDPCVNVHRAAGNSPLIDDFEDADARSLATEARGLLWMLHYDFDEQGKTLRFPPAEVRPEGGEDNRFALHVTGPELRDWGGTTQLPLTESGCYDASAYAGIHLWLRGPGRILVSIQEVDSTPVRWGGRCKKDCHRTHSKSVLLDASWQHVVIRWAELRQRGYDTKPLDPTAINSIMLRVDSEDTPFDFWVDDVAFLSE
jgi:hypothetical protein